MALGLRIFLVKDDDTLERISQARYKRLLRREPHEGMPELAGKCVRSAVVVVNLAERKPVSIDRIQYSQLYFDCNGLIDIEKKEAQVRLALEIIPALMLKQEPGKVIDARHHFAKKRYNNAYRWKPTREIEAAIIGAVLGK